MDIHTVSSDCVALIVHRELKQDGTDAAALVRSALVLNGLPDWPRMEVDLFPAGDETLIVARPAPEFAVSIADYALPFLPEI